MNTNREINDREIEIFTSIDDSEIEYNDDNKMYEDTVSLEDLVKEVKRMNERDNYE